MTASIGIKTSDSQCAASEQPMDAALRAVRLRFIETVLTRLLQFEDMKQAFASDPGDMAPLSEIGAMAHKIAGVAETLGFGDIGRLSMWIDGQIVRGVNAGDPPGTVWQTIAAPLEDMLQKMEDLLDA
jgi:Hpt domain